MDNASPNDYCNDRWRSIEQQTTVLFKQIAHSDSEAVVALLQARQEELELFFQELEYSTEIAGDIEAKIKRLLKQDAELMSLCHQQQKNILDEQKQLKVSKEAISAYETELANEES